MMEGYFGSIEEDKNQFVKKKILMFDFIKSAEKFDELFPKYNDNAYKEILEQFDVYLNLDLDVIQKPEFASFWKIVMPFIKVKNYKSQIPFPENIKDITSLLESIIKLKQMEAPRLSDGNVQEIFKNLINIKGLDLPTTSAIFHFCFPDQFPIVDVNVETACKWLFEKEKEFSNNQEPKLPASNTSWENKLEKYIVFVDFIKKINLKTNKNLSLREIDKALMVFGYRNKL